LSVLVTTSVYDSVYDLDWANELLRYGIHVLKTWWIKPSSPKNSVLVKKRLVEIFIERLDHEGYWWQATRLRNHLHKFLHACRNMHDTPPREEEEEVSS